MKRLAICALGVMLLAGMAGAQDATVWLQWQGNTPEDHEKCLGTWETAVIQLWMEVHDDGNPYTTLVNVDAILASDNLGGGYPHYEVTAFNDFGPWGGFGRQDPVGGGRGFFTNPPDPDMPLNLNYQFVGGDVTMPYTGIVPGTYLLDEIVIHAILFGSQGHPCPPCDTAAADRILFAADTMGPGGLIWHGTPSYGYYLSASIAVATGMNKFGTANDVPLYVCVLPEPASLSLLVLGGLAAIRRRR